MHTSDGECCSLNINGPSPSPDDNQTHIGQEKKCCLRYAQTSGLATLSSADEYMHLDLYILSFLQCFVLFMLPCRIAERRRRKIVTPSGDPFTRARARPARSEETRAGLRREEGIPKDRGAGRDSLRAKYKRWTPCS